MIAARSCGARYRRQRAQRLCRHRQEPADGLVRNDLPAPPVVLAGLLFPQERPSETELGKLAAAMKPGTWAELKTEGYTRELLGGHDILVYADRAVWDPRSRQVLFLGQDHLRPPPRFIAYQAAVNRWMALPTPPWAAKLKWFHG